MTTHLNPETGDGAWSRGGPFAQVDYERHREHMLDEALKDSFPASDPPSIAWSPRPEW